MLYKHKCSPVFDARPRLHVIRNDIEKVTLNVGGSTDKTSVFIVQISANTKSNAVQLDEFTR